jgi:hypothetical protein
MSIKKKSVLLVGAAVLMFCTSVLAELSVTPYGAAQYRLREEITTLGGHENEDQDRTFSNYSHRLCWRTGVKAKWDDVLSLQFQIGNDWGNAENVSWGENRSNAGSQTYVHLASAKWNPGSFFIEAGKVALNSNGTLDLLWRSKNYGTNLTGLDGSVNLYRNAGYDDWGQMNNSLIGLRVGAPLVDGDVKVGVELFHTVFNPRSTSSTSYTESNGDVKSIPQSEELAFILTAPIVAGDFKITPEITMIFNRLRSWDATKFEQNADHEMMFGFAGGYKISDEVSANFNFGFATISDENTKASGAKTATAQGMLIGAGSTIKKVGPGDLQLAVNYNLSNPNAEVDDNELNQIGTDIRYAIPLHKNFKFTPRWRTYGDMGPTMPNWELKNRFELIFEGSF